MATIYYPKGSVIFKTDTQTPYGLYEQVAISVTPNTIIYFDTSSNLNVISSSTIYHTASNSITASYLIGSGLTTYQTITGSYTISNSDSVVYASASNQNIILTLPSTSSVAGQLFRIKKIDSTGYEIIISSSVNRRGVTIVPTYVSVVTPAGHDKQWSLLLNPILTTPITGSTNWNPSPESNIEFITGSTTNGSMNTIVNEGTKLASGWFSTNNDMITVNFGEFVSLGIDLNNNRDILVLAIRTAGAASDGYASLGFKEII